MSLSRRRFVSMSFGASLFGAAPLLAFKPGSSKPIVKWQKDPAGLLDLPDGFSYRVLDHVGNRMHDGFKVPGRPDGMACFRSGRDLILMRNHELGDTDKALNPNSIPADYAFDPKMPGGVSRLVVDPYTLKVKYRNMVLVGTARNCAGGKSPWGWLTCEESMLEGHGYVFLCDIYAKRLRRPRRIAGYGRFNHEAAVVDPTSFIAYLTEDQVNGCFYRFVPTSSSNPFAGKLQAMRVKAQQNFLSYEQSVVGEFLPVDWVDVQDFDPKKDTVRLEAQSKGAAIVSRGEGLAWHKGEIYFCATNGGPKKGGQIFRYIPDRSNAGGQLQLVAQSEDRQKLDMPDNIYVTARGHVFMAEDGDGEQCIRVLKADGSVVDFARNAKSHGEMAGVCFDPSENILFCNLQEDGLTLAVRGPFANL